VTVVYLLVSAFIAAWAAVIVGDAKTRGVHLCATTVHIVFFAIAIGAGIQLLFRG